MPRWELVKKSLPMIPCANPSGLPCLPADVNMVTQPCQAAGHCGLTASTRVPWSTFALTHTGVQPHLLSRQKEQDFFKCLYFFLPPFLLLVCLLIFVNPSSQPSLAPSLHPSASLTPPLTSIYLFYFFARVICRRFWLWKFNSPHLSLAFINPPKLKHAMGQSVRRVLQSEMTDMWLSSEGISLCLFVCGPLLGCLSKAKVCLKVSYNMWPNMNLKVPWMYINHFCTHLSQSNISWFDIYTLSSTSLTWTWCRPPDQQIS